MCNYGTGAIDNGLLGLEFMHLHCQRPLANPTTEMGASGECVCGGNGGDGIGATSAVDLMDKAKCK